MNYNNYTSSKESIIGDEFFSLPDMGDFLDKDSFEEAIKNIDGKNDNPMFYVETPFAIKHGYYPEENVLVFSAKFNTSENAVTYGKMDGDTLEFDLSSVSTDDAPFEINGTSYKNVVDYLTKQKTIAGITRDSLSLRFLGINCPEIPHLEDMPSTKDDKIVTIKYSVLIDALKRRTSVNVPGHVFSYPIDNFQFVKNRFKADGYPYEPKEDIPMLCKKVENNGDSDTYFYEILADSQAYGYPAKKVVKKDESDVDNEYAKQGIRCQQIVKQEVDGAEEIVIVADRTTLNRKSSEIPEEYRRIEYNPLQEMLNPFYGFYIAYKLIFGETPAYRYLGYMPYGNDNYGRLLAAIYIKKKDDKGNTIWINLNKRVAEECPLTKILPDFTSNPTYIDKFGYASDAFKLWSYDKSKQLYVDALSNIYAEDRDDRSKIQKDIAGLDLDQVTEHTMLIGDVLLMVPPTSVRVISQTKSERVSLLRSKGSATKTLPKSERLIEMQLYFNGEQGINGIPYEQATPSGDKMVYYMNGLRALIAQFRYTPFLPVSNEYLNNVLNIEAVTLASYTVSTLPDYPRTVQVSITLQEFNYRHYMPEIPIPDESLGQDIFTNMFASTINFPVMRYYYQRAIAEGERIKEMDMNDPAYIASTFGSKTALQPMKFAMPKIDFYIANEEELKQKVQLKDKVKKEPLGIVFKLNEAKRQWMNEMGKTYINIQTAMEESKEALKDINNIEDGNHMYVNKIPGEIVIAEDTNVDSITVPFHANDVKGTTISKDKKKIFDAMLRIKKAFTKNLSNQIVNSIQVCEKMKKDKDTDAETFELDIKIGINMSLLQDNKNLADFRQYFAKQFQCKDEEILTDNIATISYTAAIEKTGGYLSGYQFNSDLKNSQTIDSKFFATLAAMSGVDTLGDSEGGYSGLNPGGELDETKNNLDLESPTGTSFDLYPIVDGALTITNVTCSYNNVLTNISLKAMDSYAPQYAGGTDTIVDITMMTQDETAVGLLHTLPRICTQRLIDYRKVLTVSPLRMDSEITRMMGVNEVVIESLDINTVPNHPGLYNISMRLISVDRSMRNKEALKRLDIQNTGIRTSDVFRTKSIMDINKALGQVELYPDLELPTIDELERLGFNFIRYKYDRDRVFPDADFYFVYGHAFSSQMLRKSLSDFFSNPEHAKKAFTISGDLGNQPDADLTMDFDGKNLLSKSIMTAESTELQKRMDDLNNLYKQELIKIGKVNNSFYQKMNGEDTPVLNPNDPTSIWALYSLQKTEEATKLMNKLDEFVDVTTFNSFDINPDIKIPMKETKDAAAKVDGGENEPDDIGTLKDYKEQIKDKIIEILKTAIKSENKVVVSNPSVSNGTENGIYYNNLPGDKGNGVFYNDHSSKDVSKINTLLVDENSTVLASTCESDFKEISKNLMQDKTYSELLKLVSTLMKIDNDTDFKTKIFPNMMFAAACALTGEMTYRPDSKIKEYGPTIVKAVPDKDGKSVVVPFCLTDLSGQGASEMMIACNDEERAKGKVFGPYGIKRYTADFIERFSGNIPIQQGTAGFLDPYYNRDISKALLETEVNDDEFKKREKEYINGILNDMVYAQHAFFRITLFWLYYLIDKDLLPTLSMLYAGKLEEIIKQAKDADEGFLSNMQDWLSKTANNLESSVDGLLSNVNLFSIGDMAKNDMEKNKTENDIIDGKNKTLEVLKGKLDKIGDNAKEYKKNLYAGFMCVPFILACTEMDTTIYNYINEGKISELKQLVAEVKTTYNSGNFSVGEQALRKFLEVLNKDYDNSEMSESDSIDDYSKYNRYKKIFLYAAEDPKLWILHSFYDMVKNDMRGRMARAFPTYYMLLVDEGREFGLWKLHDNFYNMSAISEFEVTKSRKIAADTAKIVLTNMYGTFTTEDEDMKDEYTYDFKEIWDSIFSPRKYFEQIEQRRLNAREVNRAKLVPGTRIHLRMGYSGNAASMPILFNGSVAEISTGELVTLVAQGDGVEISNNAMFNPSDTDTAEELKYSDTLPVIKTIKEWFDQSATPYKILVNPLTYRGTFIESKIRDWTDSRFFSANPFGMVHFGDPEYKVTHPEYGEIAQNIYEAVNRPTWSDTIKADTLASEWASIEAPKIKVNIQNKSYWDLMNICASVSPDFMTSVVPFGMRSSIFYGAPRYYVAYDYTYSSTGDIIEKRKPFQQYHVLTSYTDIIKNNIMASETDVRTCAMGYYKGPGNLSSKVQSVGPLFLDIDIYPEKQKMMTVDCGFQYKPTDVPFTVPFVDNVFDEWSDNGGYQIAWRATAMGLKNAVKDMYKGDLIILGDPTIKPYDKIYINDSYESMMGAFEVEAVVHRFATDTGFTTSILPDCISAIDDKYEMTTSCAFAEAVAPTVALHGVMCGVNKAFYETTKPMYMSMRNTMKKGLQLGEGLVKQVGKVVGKENIAASSNITEKILGKTADVMFDLSPLDIKLYQEVNKFKDYAKSFSVAKEIGTTKQLQSLLSTLDKAADNIDNLNPDKVVDILKEIESEGVVSGKKLEELQDTMKKVKDLGGNYNPEDLKKLLTIDEDSLSNYVKAVKKSVENGAELSEDAKKALDALDKMKGIEPSDIKKYKEAISNMKMLSDKVDNLDDIADFTKGAVKNINSISDSFKYLDNLEDAVSDVNKMKKMTTGLKTVLGKNVIMMAARYTLLKGVQEAIERKLKNLQVLTVFPIIKEGMVMVAGVDGHKGSIFGSPRYDTPGIFETCLIDFMEDRQSASGIAWSIFRDMFLTTDEMKKIADSYKRGKGYGVPDGQEEASSDDLAASLLASLAKDKVSTFSEYKARFLVPRVKNISKDSSEEDKQQARVSRTRYALLGIPDARKAPEIAKQLLPISEMKDVKLLLDKDCFKMYSDTTVVNDNVAILKDDFSKAGGGSYSGVPYKLDRKNNVYDIPFLRPDAIVVLERIVDSVAKQIQPDYAEPSCDFKKFKEHPIILHNATRVNDEKGWYCTGYCFTIQVKSYDEFGNILEGLNKEQDEIAKDNSIVKSKLFQYKKDSSMGDNTYNIFVACPL